MFVLNVFKKQKLRESRSVANIRRTHFHGKRQDVYHITLEHNKGLAGNKFTASFFIEIWSSLGAIILVLKTVLHEAVAMEEDEELKSCCPNCWHHYVGE